jgi:DNA-binding CsgD family transcriptional regulator
VAMDIINKRIFDPKVNFLKINSDISSYHLYLKDMNGRFLECNESQAKSFGLSRINDVLGQSDDDFLPKKQADIIKQNDKSVIKMAMPRMFIEDCKFSPSQNKRMISFKMPVNNPDNKNELIGIFGISASIDTFNSFSELNSFNDIFCAPTVAEDSAVILGKKISKREKECLQHLANGMTAKKIARVLDLSPRTVEFYIENLKKKFSCLNRTELIAKALPLLNK